MARRGRIAGFAAAAALVVAGGLCAVLVEGLTGELLTIVLMSLGFAGGLLLMFLDIGLGEEHDLAREAASRRRRELRRLDVLRRPRLRQRPRRPS